MFTLRELESILPIVGAAVRPTPHYAWPLLQAHTGLEVIVKHENYTPVGAFKVRGGLVYVDRQGRGSRGLITASRGNHGQSLAFAGARVGRPVTIVVPAGNSIEKTAAMRALGAEVVEHGPDFDAAKQYAEALASERGLHFVPTFHPDLVLGVASFAYELFTAGPSLDALYVPIGLGSAVCGAVGVRNVLGINTEVIGVVPERADAYHRSLQAGRSVSIAAADTFADGLAVRIPDPGALQFLRKAGVRVITVSEHQIAEAIRILFSATHSCAEGAGAAAFAGLLKDRRCRQGQRVGVVLTGQNIDRDWMATVLAGGVPRPRLSSYSNDRQAPSAPTEQQPRRGHTRVGPAPALQEP